MDKIGSFFSFGGNILGILGSFGSMATSLIKIAGMASAVYAIYEFMTGDRRDGSKNAKDIFYEYLEKYLEKQLAGYSPSTKTIKTISNLYKIQADVSLEPDKTYKYTIYATLQ